MTIRTFSLSMLTVPLLLLVGLPLIVLTLLWLDLPVRAFTDHPIGLAFFIPFGAVYVGISLHVDVKRKLPYVRVTYRDLVVPVLIAIGLPSLVLGFLWTAGERASMTGTLLALALLCYGAGRWWLMRRLEAKAGPDAS
ncbi:MAG: hypothetical protein AAGJ10_06015 [Bacteroidota bacterium]